MTAFKLHPVVLMVGDRPNPKKNCSMNVPFVGTRSYKTLLEWVYRMDVDIRRVQIENAYTVDGTIKASIIQMVPSDWKVIALGAAATAALDELNKLRLSEPQIRFFSLPHPSGSNRSLNDKKKLSELLSRCRAYIYNDVKYG